jgi:hypothetical protein
VGVIDRIDNPSEEFFRRTYLDRSRPVVIRQTESKPAQFDWTFDHLARMVGDCTVPVYDWGPQGPTIEDRFEIVYMKMAEAIRHATAVTSTATQRYAVCQLPVEFVGDLAATYRSPSFLEHVDTLDRVAFPFREPHRRALFISFFRGIHWHNGRDAVAQMLTGRKKFILYDPRDSKYLYPRRLVKSGRAWFDETEAVFCSEIPFELGADAIDHERFPLFRQARPYEVEVEAGESLYIPSHWWHYTTAIEPCVVAVEFWDAPLKRWGFPIAWRSVLMKPYRKYLYHRLVKLKAFSRDREVLQH